MIRLSVDLSPALAKLQGMGERAADAVREAAFKGTKLVFDEAYRRAPQSEKAHWFYSRRHKDGTAGAKYLFQPGSLKKSIYIKHLDELQIAGRQEVYQISWRKRSSAIGYVPYAHMVEYGTVKMPPMPFVRPAYDAVKPRAEAMIIQTIRKAIADERTSVD